MHQAVPAGLPDGRSSRPGVRDRVVGQNSAVLTAAFGHAVDEPPPKAQPPPTMRTLSLETGRGAGI